MGMFDTIQDELFCPFCGAKQEKDSFQSKDTGDIGTSWTIKEIVKFFDKEEKLEIYTNCDKCKKWISINLIVWRMVTQSHSSSILKSKDVQKPKVVILDDNELSVAMYAEEYPENFKAITSNLKAKDVQEASQ